MPETLTSIKDTVRNYLATSLLEGIPASEIADDTALITGGIMDSISTLQLVDFLEKEFHVEFQAHEVDQDNFDSVSVIADIVESKLK